ncbi:hypothetical protein QBC40DRAFT_258359 [Triangularia verruculosa]|uniref:Transmembrane protein n=1 Tax=Triangularia verruculosa TaxID=2587418 RepID=A0AAN6XE05_9PEZI|nr:hypothetical protein QBC40DRAFT_258359 [Triangularia verruculosa]
MAESDMRFLIDMVGRALIFFWGGMLARVVLWLFEEELGWAWWYRDTPCFLFITFGIPGFLFWIGEVFTARRRSREWRALEEGVRSREEGVRSGEEMGGDEEGVGEEEKEGYVVVEKGDLITP